MTAVLVFEFVLCMCVLFAQSLFSKTEFDMNDSVTESPNIFSLTHTYTHKWRIVWRQLIV